MTDHTATKKTTSKSKIYFKFSTNPQNPRELNVAYWNNEYKLHNDTPFKLSISKEDGDGDDWKSRDTIKGWKAMGPYMKSHGDENAFPMIEAFMADKETWRIISEEALQPYMEAQGKAKLGFNRVIRFDVTTIETYEFEVDRSKPATNVKPLQKAEEKEQLPMAASVKTGSTSFGPTFFFTSLLVEEFENTSPREMIAKAAEGDDLQREAAAYVKTAIDSFDNYMRGMEGQDPLGGGNDGVGVNTGEADVPAAPIINIPAVDVVQLNGPISPYTFGDSMEDFNMLLDHQETEKNEAELEKRSEDYNEIAEELEYLVAFVPEGYVSSFRDKAAAIRAGDRSVIFTLKDDLMGLWGSLTDAYAWLLCEYIIMQLENFSVDLPHKLASNQRIFELPSFEASNRFVMRVGMDEGRDCVRLSDTKIAVFMEEASTVDTTTVDQFVKIFMPTTVLEKLKLTFNADTELIRRVQSHLNKEENVSNDELAKMQENDEVFVVEIESLSSFEFPSIIAAGLKILDTYKVTYGPYDVTTVMFGIYLPVESFVEQITQEEELQPNEEDEPLDQEIPNPASLTPEIPLDKLPENMEAKSS
jgi:hypothetical protein